MTDTPLKNEGGLSSNIKDLTHDQRAGLASIPPEKLGEETLNQLGHRKKPILNAIRANCFDCAGNSYAEVRKCISVGCSLWAYRTGKNPFRKTE
ncbi:hypothetical protein N9P07_01195 [Alphaproteobacteria bacterium]|nr:hypothetical protein [Alphaproteobacteria bacterium]